jgi:hypothetical protein
MRPPVFMSNPLVWIQDKLTSYSKDEIERFKAAHLFLKKGFGYLAEQTTQPQTLGYSLTDSPVGLLGWIYEKVP